MKKVLLTLMGLVVLCAGGGFGYLALRSPNVAPAKDLKVEMTPQRLERGKYIFDVVADCNGCHSERDWTKFSAPVITGRTGVGTLFPPEFGIPGQVAARNITPDEETGIGTWTDGEKVRAIREGIGKDGRALFPMMPYTTYREMSDEDVYSLIAYLNTLPPVRNELPPTKLNFPINYLIKSAPQPVVNTVAAPDKSNPVRYGEYLAKMGGCIGCHTQSERGQPKPDMLLAGGREFNLGKMSVRSANITPEVETGIGGWSEQRFISKFQGYANLTPSNAPVANQANFTLMAWQGFSHLSEEDLLALYAFLRTVQPIKNAVDPHKPLTQS